MPRRIVECRREWNSEENKDVVIFHMFPRNPLSPSMSPYVLKLETFLRMHDVKYKVDHSIPMHPVTQKCPWISYNGEEVADSQHIMEFLSEKLSLNPKHDLDGNPKDKQQMLPCIQRQLQICSNIPTVATKICIQI